MNRDKLIAGIIILISSSYWIATEIGGWEWIVFIAQIVVGTVLIAKARSKRPPAISTGKTDEPRKSL